MSAIGSRHGSELHSSKIAQSDGAQASASDLPIETLIDHLVNAKKALTSLDTLYCANEIVATAQTALEESVLLSAQTGFLRRAITHQVRVVDRVRLGLDQEVKNAEDDFQVRSHYTLLIQSTMLTATNRPSYRT